MDRSTLPVDKIEGADVYLHDLKDRKPGIYKKIHIMVRPGKYKEYELKRTGKGGYLLN